MLAVADGGLDRRRLAGSGAVDHWWSDWNGLRYDYPFPLLTLTRYYQKETFANSGLKHEHFLDTFTFQRLTVYCAQMLWVVY